MPFCKNCGAQVGPGVAVCPQCDKPTGQSDVSSGYQPPEHTSSIVNDDQLSAAKDAVSATAGKIAAGASSLSSQLGQRAGEGKKSFIEKRIEREANAARAATAEPARVISADDIEQYMSDTELWGDLLRSSRRAKYFNEDESSVQESDFMDELQKQLDENKVPAAVEKRTVKLDRHLTSQEAYFVKSKNGDLNPLSFLVQFNHVGKYTFVEEKTFTKPPKLPKYPDELVKIPDNLKAAIVCFIIGLICLTVGIAFFPLIFVGLGLVGYGIYGLVNLISRRKHNARCREEAEAYVEAWDNWSDFVLAYEYEDEIDGGVGRLNDAVSDCIKQVSERLLKSAPVSHETSAQSLAEISQLVRSKKQDSLQTGR